MMKVVVVVIVLLVCGAIAEEALQGDVVPGLTSLNKVSKNIPVVVGGWRSIVSLRRGPAAVFSHACIGNILTVDFILTVASCFEVSWDTDYNNIARWRVVAGSNSLTTGGVTLQLRLIRKHPAWNLGTLDNDIAILALTTSLAISTTVGQVIIPTQNSNILKGSVVRIAGWGSTVGGIGSNVLLEGELQVFDQRECNDLYAAIGGEVTARMICTSHPSGGNDACIGDYGGPVNFNGLLHGLVSWGYGCVIGGFPVVNTRVPQYSFWIINTVNSM